MVEKTHHHLLSMSASSNHGVLEQESKGNPSSFFPDLQTSENKDAMHRIPALEKRISSPIWRRFFYKTNKWVNFNLKMISKRPKTTLLFRGFSQQIRWTGRWFHHPFHARPRWSFVRRSWHRCDHRHDRPAPWGRWDEMEALKQHHY